jgi:hypothetical protein
MRHVCVDIPPWACFYLHGNCVFCMTTPLDLEDLPNLRDDFPSEPVLPADEMPDGTLATSGDHSLVAGTRPVVDQKRIASRTDLSVLPRAPASPRNRHATLRGRCPAFTSGESPCETASSTSSRGSAPIRYGGAITSGCRERRRSVADSTARHGRLRSTPTGLGKMQQLVGDNSQVFFVAGLSRSRYSRD